MPPFSLFLCGPLRLIVTGALPDELTRIEFIKPGLGQLPGRHGFQEKIDGNTAFARDGFFYVILKGRHQRVGVDNFVVLVVVCTEAGDHIFNVRVVQLHEALACLGLFCG